jgi:hypothetical protein
MNLEEKYPIMREYFKNITTLAKTPSAKYKKEIASLAELCKKLDITKAEWALLKFGSAEEQKFRGDTLLEFEICANAMRTASLISDKEHMKLKEMFEEEGPESDKSVTVIFTEYTKPDDWEDYKDIRKLGDDNGLSVRQLKQVLKKALKGVS